MTKHKVILDECQCIADSLTSVYENVGIYKRPVQARGWTPCPLHGRWIPLGRGAAGNGSRSSPCCSAICEVHREDFGERKCFGALFCDMSDMFVLPYKSISAISTSFFRMSFRLVCPEHDLVWHPPIFPKVAAPPSFVDRKPLEFKLHWPKNVLNIPSHVIPGVIPCVYPMCFSHLLPQVPCGMNPSNTPRSSKTWRRCRTRCRCRRS